MLTGRLPKHGQFELCINAGAVEGAKDTKRIQKVLIEWIKEKAPSLKLGSPDVAPAHYIREKPIGIPFEVTLLRWPGNDGKLWIVLYAPKDLEEKRRQRINDALEGKCPKLYKARGVDKTSILVLELNDISLGNYTTVTKDVVQNLSHRNDVPDDIYLIKTELEQWCVWILKEGKKLFRDVENRGPHYLNPN